MDYLHAGMKGYLRIIGKGTWFITLVIWGVVCYGQYPGIQLSFERQNNFTYSTRLNGKLKFESGKYSMQALFSHENLINNSRPPARFVQMLAHTDIWQYWQLKPSLAAASWTESDLFFNAQNYRVNQYLGVLWKPDPGVQIRPVIGWSWDYLSKTLDQGPTAGVFLQANHTFPDGLEMETEGYVRAKYILPRHQRNALLASRWTKTFGEEAVINFVAQGGSNQMDNYKLGSIERIKSDTAGAALNWQYELAPGLVWESQNSAVWSRRWFNYDTYSIEAPEFNDVRFQQLELNTSQRLNLRLGKLSSAFLYEYQNLARSYNLDNNQELPTREFTRLLDREKQKDYVRNLTNMELTLRGTVNRKSLLELTASNRYLQYDTPEPGNNDDHDQLSYGLSAGWQTTWSRSFVTTYKLLGSVREYAFLYAARSAENYTQRNLRMEFRFQWDMLRNLRFEGEQYVYVTYNVKDFSDLNLTDRSTRNLESNLRLNWRPAPKLNSSLSFYRKETQASYLNWKAFTETTLDTNTFYIIEQTNAFEFRRKNARSALFLDLGYRHFSQFRYQNTTMINLQGILSPINLHVRSHQTGPQTGIRFRNSKAASIECAVWWQVQYLDNLFSPIAFFPSNISSLREENLQKTDIHFRPFLKLQLNWVLGAR